MRATTLLLLTGIVFLTACQPEKDPAGLLPEADRAAQFDETARFLELGGVFYGYIDMTEVATGFGEELTLLAHKIKSTTPGEPALPLNFNRFLEASGLSGLQSVGMSSRQIEEGLFHNRTILLFPGGVKGFFSVFGKSSAPFDSLDLAPSNTDLLVEMDYHPSALRDSVLEMASALAGPLGSGILASQLSRGFPLNIG